MIWVLISFAMGFALCMFLYEMEMLQVAKPKPRKEEERDD